MEAALQCFFSRIVSHLNSFWQHAEDGISDVVWSDNACDSANFWDGNDSDSDDGVRSCLDEAGFFKQ